MTVALILYGKVHQILKNQAEVPKWPPYSDGKTIPILEKVPDDVKEGDIWSFSQKRIVDKNELMWEGITPDLNTTIYASSDEDHILDYISPVQRQLELDNYYLANQDQLSQNGMTLDELQADIDMCQNALRELGSIQPPANLLELFSLKDGYDTNKLNKSGSYLSP